MPSLAACRCLFRLMRHCFWKATLIRRICRGTLWYLYFRSCEDKWLLALWSDDCVLDSRFKLLFWVRVSYWVALYLSFIQRVREFSSSVGFHRSKDFSDFFLVARYFLTYVNTDARNLNFTFLICLSIINQNKIDFWCKSERERERERGWHFGISWGWLW